MFLPLAWYIFCSLCKNTNDYTEQRIKSSGGCAASLLHNQAPSGSASYAVFHTSRFPKGAHVSTGKFLVESNPNAYLPCS